MSRAGTAARAYKMLSPYNKDVHPLMTAGFSSEGDSLNESTPSSLALPDAQTGRGR